MHRLQLLRRVKTGDTTPKEKRGRQPVLTPEMEDKMTDLLLLHADAGFPLTKACLGSFARLAAVDAGIPAAEFNAGDDWYYVCMARYPEI